LEINKNKIELTKNILNIIIEWNLTEFCETVEQCEFPVCTWPEHCCQFVAQGMVQSDAKIPEIWTVAISAQSDHCW
jgi:hypothetical protein